MLLRADIDNLKLGLRMSKTKGYRELIKGAKTLADAQQFLHSAKNAPVSAKSLRRCEQAFSQLPFTKKEEK